MKENPLFYIIFVIIIFLILSLFLFIYDSYKNNSLKEIEAKIEMEKKSIEFTEILQRFHNKYPDKTKIYIVDDPIKIEAGSKMENCIIFYNGNSSPIEVYQNKPNTYTDIILEIHCLDKLPKNFITAR